MNLPKSMLPPRLILLLAASAVAAPVRDARAQVNDEQILAERYAPIVQLVARGHGCMAGEQYEPIDVAALFDQPTVALRGPWGPDLVKIAPSASDLTAARYEYALDFPGNPLRPGCGYELWARHITQGRPPTVYAHVATDSGYPNKLALQYWLFYVFNDWNNTHEGDWEMIQLDFDARNAHDALSRTPTSVGYSQHDGAERAQWGDHKLEILEGTHPRVHPAAGSHANFFREALYLGTAASEGVGCDDTRGPTRDIRPVVVTIPTDPIAARESFPWIEFAGQWGEFQAGFFNGPSGPNRKTQWVAPLRRGEGWRTRSIAVATSGVLGTRATDFFCGAVAAGSNGLRRAIEHPLPVIIAIAALALLAALAFSRTSWQPSAPLRLARRRAWGQIIAAAARMYIGEKKLFLGIGMLALPVSIAVTLLRAGLFGASRLIGIEPDGERGGILLVVTLAIGTAVTVFGFGLIAAAVSRGLIEVDAGRSVSPPRAYRLAFASMRPPTQALLIAALVISLLLTSLVFVPIAIWFALRWALVVPVIEVERVGAIEGLRRSACLVRHGRAKIASIVVATLALGFVAGPFLGTLLILVTRVPLAWINLVSGIAFAVAMPFVAMAAVYVYFDARVRDETREHVSEQLPAEIQLSS